jgi:type IV secretion system protein VirD4
MNSESHKYEKYIPSDSESMWADPDELKNAATVKRISVDADNCQGCGLPIISDGRTAYVDNSDTHTLVFGATGSKKTRLFVMPLINFFALSGESFIVSDPKGEIYQKTSGHVSAQGYNAIVLNFRDLHSSSFWNPLKLPYDLYHKGKIDEAASLLTDFINSLAAPQRQGSKAPYFIELGCSMALAYFLFFIETAAPNEANMYNFANFFATKASHDSTEEISRCVADGSIASVNLKGVLANRDAKSTFGNVAACVSTMINPFIIRKTLCQVLSKSSFDIRDIGKEKTAIYIIVPDEKTTLHFLVTAFIKQTYEALIHEAQQQKDRKLPVRLNIILDEFGNIPTIPDMASMISAARSRNMRFFLMAQGMHQLQHKYYKDAETIKGNCDNWVFLTSREHALLQEISIMCGVISYSDLEGERKIRSLISMSELQRLKKENGEALILHGRHYPFVTERWTAKTVHVNKV